MVRVFSLNIFTAFQNQQPTNSINTNCCLNYILLILPSSFFYVFFFILYILGIRIRPSQGLSSADIFVPGLRLWIDIYESLSDVGYTIQNMHMASYDWRLKYEDLENRDSFFSGLKSKVELLYNTNHQIKIVVISHSMGTPVWLHYMQWISKIDSKWIDTYIR